MFRIFDSSNNSVNFLRLDNTDGGVVLILCDAAGKEICRLLHIDNDGLRLMPYTAFTDLPISEHGELLPVTGHKCCASITPDGKYIHLSGIMTKKQAEEYAFGILNKCREMK